ncbi:unnamed protein product [Urochloa humidicola]
MRQPSLIGANRATSSRRRGTSSSQRGGPPPRGVPPRSAAGLLSPAQLFLFTARWAKTNSGGSTRPPRNEVAGLATRERKIRYPWNQLRSAHCGRRGTMQMQSTIYTGFTVRRAADG